VVKTRTDAGLASAVEVLEGRDRVEEIARMLGGVRITATTRSHAEEMLAQAGREPDGEKGEGRRVKGKGGG
jgi:DNA repair protein RecN (Recombination protein N)